MKNLTQLPVDVRHGAPAVTFGLCAAADPRIDQASRTRTATVTEIIAKIVAREVTMPDGSPVNVVWTPLLIDGEKQADIVARQFIAAGVDARPAAGAPPPRLISRRWHRSRTARGSPGAERAVRWRR